MSDRTPGGSGTTFRENRSPEALVYSKHGKIRDRTPGGDAKIPIEPLD
jgi:hypothetical protein